MRLQDDELYLMSLVLHRYFDGMSHEFLRRKLGRSEWRCLAVLAERDGTVVSELTELTQQPQTTISRVIARLERDGLISRRQRRGDGRFIELHITSAGRTKYAELVPIAQRQHRKATQGVREPTLRSLRAVLHRMLDNLAVESAAADFGPSARPARRRRAR